MTPSHLSRRQLVLASAGAAALGATPLGHAQIMDSGKVVKVVVGFPAGQATDMVTRVLAERMRAITGDNYVVDNRPGQGGSLALGQLAKSPTISKKGC